MLLLINFANRVGGRWLPSTYSRHSFGVWNESTASISLVHNAVHKESPGFFICGYFSPFGKGVDRFHVKLRKAIIGTVRTLLSTGSQVVANVWPRSLHQSPCPSAYTEGHTHKTLLFLLRCLSLPTSPFLACNVGRSGTEPSSPSEDNFSSPFLCHLCSWIILDFHKLPISFTFWLHQ